MDPKKQKRLGAAPIASFEKSLEDATSTHMGVATSAFGATSTLPQSSMYEENYQKTVGHNNNNRNGIEMNPNMERTTKIKTIEETTSEILTTENKKQMKEELSESISANAESDNKRPPTLKEASENNLQTYKGFSTLTTPQTPRIEFSRASSGSTKEENSRESSPENVFDQVGTGTLQETIGLGFREEGALELRSSTEELYFMDKVQKKEEQVKIQLQQQQQQQNAKRSSPHFFKIEEHQMYLQQHQRKDSASSEVAALLCISGRTSRISSVGSQGSAVSHLSAISGVSRSPSPHRMLLETSFCGPKSMDNAVDCRVPSSVEPQTVKLLEQMLLRRRQDPTQAVLAEGIHIEGSPKKQVNILSNGDTKSMKEHTTSKIIDDQGNQTKSNTMGAQRSGAKSPGQMVVGKTPSGKEYIRINLKPDHMYPDKGIASNERVVDAPNTLAPVYATIQKKPGTLSLGGKVLDGNLLTPNASPKATRHSKDVRSSRSPSPATISVSRKSSFSSLFRFGGGGKDSPDSPKERSRSRSKSKEPQVSQSQNVTPNKQKSVLAIFKPSGKRSSSSGMENKISSPSEPQSEQSHQQLRSASQTPVVSGSASNSRPSSRLRYYDPPVEGVIHIPLHTPPEEKETRKVLQGIQQLNAEPVRPIPAPITASQLAAAAKALKPVAARKDSGNGSIGKVSFKANDKTNHLQNIDAIQTLSQDDDSKPHNWSLEVRHSSQDSQDTVASESSYGNAIRIGLRSASHLPDVKEQEPQQNNDKNESDQIIHRLPSVESNTSACEPKIIETVATINTITPELTAGGQNSKDDIISAKEKRRLLFATRLGSGSQEQVFSTQFSISKTESLSSQLSDRGQETIMESSESEFLQRQGTVIRRTEEDTENSPCMPSVKTIKGSKRQGHTDVSKIRQKSCSTSEDERVAISKAITTAVVMRRKESSDEHHRKSRSTSEEDADNINPRHSRYLENVDIRKRYQDTIPRKPKRQSITETKLEEEEVDPFEVLVHVRQERKPQIPQPPPPSTTPTPSPAASNATSARGSRTPTPTMAVRSQSQSPVDHSRQTPTKPARNITPTSLRSQVTTPTSPLTVTASQTISPAIKRASTLSDRQSAAVSTDEPIESSESERDSGAGGPGSSSQEHQRRHIPHCHAAAIEDHESTGLVSQESFDDELPYIPTTLPEERAQGIAIIPMKERANMELKMCPVERPRSTTPLNPSHLEEFGGGLQTPQESPHELYGSVPVRGEKLRISLPRKDPAKEKVQCVRSPRRSSNASGKSWFEFAEEGLRATTAGNFERKDSSKQLVDNIKKEIKKPSSAPTSAMSKTVAVAQKALSSGKSNQRKLSGHWIDFENIPEKRKPPKRITALPKETTITTIRSKSPKTKHSHAQPDLTTATTHADGKLHYNHHYNHHYNYVKPEDCQCECHEVSRGTETTTSGLTSSGEGAIKVSSLDLLQQGELQQGDDMLPLLNAEGHDGIEISHLSDSSREYSYYTDDEGDVPERRRTSGRKARSPAKGEFPRRDYTQSPRNRKFPDNRK